MQVLHIGEESGEEPGEYEPGPDVPEDEDYYPALFPLIGSPVLGNVKTLIVGELLSPEEEAEGYFSCHSNGRAVAGVVKTMPGNCSATARFRTASAACIRKSSS